MNKTHEAVMNIKFKAIAKRFVLAALCVVLIGGIVSGVLLRTQIREAVALLRTETSSSRQEDQWTGWDQVGRSEEDHAGHDADGHDDWLENAVLTGRITMPSTAAVVAVSVTALLCALLFTVYWLLAALWLYQTAARSAMHPLLWGLLGLVGNLAAVAAFLVVRGFLRVRCPACGYWQAASPFCGHCGTALEAKCPACGAVVKQNDRFCGACGEKLSRQGTDAE